METVVVQSKKGQALPIYGERQYLLPVEFRITRSAGKVTN